MIPPEKGVSDLASSRSPLGVSMSSLVPDNWATDERRGMLSWLAPSCWIMNLFFWGGGGGVGVRGGGRRTKSNLIDYQI